MFGKCQKYGRKNEEKIARLNDNASFPTDYELTVESKIQQDLQHNKNKNRKVVQDQFDNFEKNFHPSRDCTQMLFSYQPLNLIFKTLASLLSILYADIKVDLQFYMPIV